MITTLYIATVFDVLGFIGLISWFVYDGILLARKRKSIERPEAKEGRDHV